VILNTVPAWKKAYKLRVAVFVEYESDVEEERGRVKSLLENLRIEAEVLVFWLASGKLATYEVIVNGASPSKEDEKEVEDCLAGQEWWDEIQKLRGNRGATSATEDFTDIASIFTSGSAWPEASFQQGPRDERVERFLGLRRLLRKSRRKHTMSGLTKLGVSLGMRTHRLSDNVVKAHASQGSASEDSGSSSDDSDYDAIQDSGDESEGRNSAASEADIDDFESASEPESPAISKIRRRRSHGDTMRGPPPSKKSTGEREVRIPQPPSRRPLPSESTTTVSTTGEPAAPAPDLAFTRNVNPEESKKPPSVSNLATSLKAESDGKAIKRSSIKEPNKTLPKRPIKPPTIQHL